MAHRDDPRERYNEGCRRLDEAVEDGKVRETTRENIQTALDALDPEKRTATFIHDGEKQELASNSLQCYVMRLRMVATEVDGPLLDLTNDDIDSLLDDLMAGNTEIGPADGYSTATAGQFESALKAFYRYHDSHDVDPDEIPVETSRSTSVDERDLWEVEEIEGMRSVLHSKRNEALFELLAYTGQRIRVIQTMRVKDVDPDKGSTGRYWVNEEVEGRKNREGHGPLLGAQGAVRRWLEVHPTGNPDDALITCPPNNTGGATPGERITQQSLRRVLKRIADKAGVNKDVHPHMFRHYFTTIAKRPKERGGFGMDSDHIKRLRGDAPGSNVMETTYAHLVDEDSASHAESAFTGEKPEGNALTPAAPCSVCGEMLQAGDKACSNCGAARSPDAQKDEVQELRDRIEELEAEKEVQQDMGATKALASGDVSVEELEAIADDDALLAKLIELRSD